MWKTKRYEAMTVWWKMRQKFFFSKHTIKCFAAIKPSDFPSFRRLFGALCKTKRYIYKHIMPDEYSRWQLKIKEDRLSSTDIVNLWVCLCVPTPFRRYMFHTNKNPLLEIKVCVIVLKIFSDHVNKNLFICSSALFLYFIVVGGIHIARTPHSVPIRFLKCELNS